MTGDQNQVDQGPTTLDPLSDSLRWALALGADPDQSPIDWIAKELDPESNGAADAVCRNVPGTDVDLDRLELLKSGFKSMRLSSESGSDRSLAARYYASTIAAGLVRHGVWITEQRTERVVAAIKDLQQDTAMPDALRNLAGRAIERIEGEVILQRRRD